MAAPEPRSRRGEFWEVLKRSYNADPDYRSVGDSSKQTPLEWLLSRSNIIDLARQAAPQWSLGYGPKRISEFADLRKEDPSVRQNTILVGDYPELEGRPLNMQRFSEAGRRAAQAVGAAAKDVTTQGLQNIWWFLNAYEAASMLAGKQVYHGALGGNLFGQPTARWGLPAEKPIPGATLGSPFSRNSMRFASAFPLILGASAATGTLFRQPGYAAVLPTTEDKRESADPLTERLMRIVGRSGALLPYDEFVQERPDVSKGEYEAYKAYLFGDKSMIKFNPDGIHGPEVNFIGKSVPLLTGVVPIAGGIIGGRMGLRKAGMRIADQYGGFTVLDGAKAERDKSKRLLAVARYNGTVVDKDTGRVYDPNEAFARYREAESGYTDVRNRVEGDLLKGVLQGSSAGLGISGAASLLLEQIRRNQNARDNAAQAEQERLPGGQP